MRKGILAAGALVWLGFAANPVTTQQPQEPEFKIPPEEAKKENPVKSSDASIAEGKKLYRFDCAMCHGATGDGKGDLAESMELKLRDLREPPTMKDYTDGGLAYLILKGKGKMPGEEGRLKGNQVWNLVNFLRSIAKKEEPAPPKEAPKKP